MIKMENANSLFSANERYGVYCRRISSRFSEKCLPKSNLTPPKSDAMRLKSPESVAVGILKQSKSESVYPSKSDFAWSRKVFRDHPPNRNVYYVNVDGVGKTFRDHPKSYSDA